jgi:glycosyltransferase involved in cell wall biosynthesis
VGGTNPSLVEALGAGNAVFAHDNGFNRWVAGQGNRYFDGTDSLAALFDEVLGDAAAIAAMRQSSLQRFEAEFTWSRILAQYEQLLESWLP